MIKASSYSVLKEEVVVKSLGERAVAARAPIVPMRWVYAAALYGDDCATFDDLREAVTTLEDVARISRRVLGGSHPLTAMIETDLRNARAALGSSS